MEPYPKSGEVCIAIWTRGHDWMDGIIRWRTSGRGTHAAFVVDDTIYENFWPRVRRRYWRAGEKEKVELYRLQDSTPADWHRLIRWMETELKNPPSYSIRDLFRFMMNIRPVRGRACFCSMWVLRGIRLCYPPKLQPLTRLQYEDYAAPATLRMSPRLVRVH